jgi:hypothetical protein
MAEQVESPAAQPRQSNTLAWALLAGVVAIQTGALGAYALKGFFFVDDFLHFFFAAGPLTIDYLKEPVFQHLIPGYRFIFWVLQHGFPMNYEAAVVGMMLFHGLSSWVMFRLLRRLCPLEVAAVLLLIWAVSPIHLRLSVWAAAGLEYFPCNFFSLLAIERMLAYWCAGRKRDLGLSLLGLVLGLSFFVKALLVVGYLGLLWILFPGLRPQQETRSRTLTSLAGMGLVAGLYLFLFIKYYFLPMDMGGAVKPTVLETLGFIGDGIVRVFLPSYAGVRAQNNTDFLIFGGVLAAAFVGACVWVRGAWRAGVFFIVSAVPNLALVAFARMKQFPDGLILFDLRFYAELAYLFTIALALIIWMRPRRQEAALAMVRGASLRVVGFAAIVVGLCGFRGYYLHKASETIIDFWDVPPVKAYMTNLTAGLKEVQRKHGGKYEQFAFFNHQVPEFIMPRWFGQMTTYGEFFQFLNPRIRTNVHASTMYIIDTGGRVRPAEFHPVAEGLLERGQACMKGGERITFVLAEPVDLKEGVVEVELEQPAEVNGLLMLSAAGEEFDEAVSWYLNHGEKESITYVAVWKDKPVKRFQLKLDNGSKPGCVKRARVGRHRLVDEVTAFPRVEARP